MTREQAPEQIERRRAQQRKYQAAWRMAHPEYLVSWNRARPDYHAWQIAKWCGRSSPRTGRRTPRESGRERQGAGHWQRARRLVIEQRCRAYTEKRGRARRSGATSTGGSSLWERGTWTTLSLSPRAEDTRPATSRSPAQAATAGRARSCLRNSDCSSRWQGRGEAFAVGRVDTLASGRGKTSTTVRRRCHTTTSPTTHLKTNGRPFRHQDCWRQANRVQPRG